MTIPPHPNAPDSNGPEQEYTLAPEPVHGHEHEHEPPHEAHADGEHVEPHPHPRYRLPLAHFSPAAMAKWKRETRFGVAAMLSFVIFVTAMIMNRGQKLPLMEVAKNGDSSKSTQATSKDSKESKSTKGEGGNSNSSPSDTEKGKSTSTPAPSSESKPALSTDKPEDMKVGSPAHAEAPAPESTSNPPVQNSLPTLPTGPGSDAASPTAEPKGEPLGDPPLPMSSGTAPPGEVNPPLPTPADGGHSAVEKTPTTESTITGLAN
ncbi:hypothetical protein ACYOEI_21430, partial [Singulisphaera rosea]